MMGRGNNKSGAAEICHSEAEGRRIRASGLRILRFAQDDNRLFGRIYGSFVAAFAALVLLLSAGAIAYAQSVDDEARRIAQELQCPVCQGLSVADSPSQLAGQMRGIIRARLEGGESRQHILDYFVERYGETVLLTPPRGGFTAFVWIAPYLVLAAGLAIVVVVVSRGARRHGEEPVSPPPGEPYFDEVDRTYEQVRDEPLR